MIPLQAGRTPEWLASLLTSEVGYLVLFGICILEGAMLLRFMPSELVVPSALFLMGTGPADVFAIVLIAVVGTTAGQIALFVFVRRVGRGHVVQSRWVPVTEDRLDRFDGWFDRWGRIAVPVSNSMLFIRGLMTFPAGLSDMRPSTFLFLSGLGSLSFQTILAGLYLHANKLAV